MQSQFSMILWLIIVFGGMYFLLIRPQKKKDQQMKELAASLEVGDSVLTISGFYGVVVDVGNDKHCRIPMERAAISQVEKPNQGTKED